MKAIVTVVIPMYGKGQLTYIALHSVENQTYKNIEIILVDDESSDQATKEVIGDLIKNNYTVLQPKHSGLAGCRNFGLKASKGEFILFLDADDFIEPTCVEEMVSNAEENNSDVVYSDYTVIHSAEVKHYIKTEAFSLEKELVANMFVATALIRKTALDKLIKKRGIAYDEKMTKGYEDWELWISLAEMGCKFTNINKSLFNYVMANSSLVFTANKYQKEVMTYIFNKHKELFQNMQLESLLRIQSDYSKALGSSKENEIKLNNLVNSTNSSSWLIKRLILNLMGKKLTQK